MHVTINISEQTMTVTSAGIILKAYSVSTAKNGVGEVTGSGCTPRGEHYIRARIGTGCPVGTVFVSRRPTGEIYTQALAKDQPKRDWILTRVLWLCGKERGVNRLGEVDTMRRYIYIHGTPDSEPIGAPISHGCIRMRNTDIIDLFDLVNEVRYVEVLILSC